MDKESLPYGAQLTNFLMRWHLLEAQTDFSYLGGLDLIDMNLSGLEIAGKPFDTHHTALKVIDKLTSNLPANSAPYLVQKVGAYHTYLSAFLDKKPEYAQVFKKVNGYEPYLFSEEEINEQIDLTKESLAELKINSPLIDVLKTLKELHPAPKNQRSLVKIFKETQNLYKKEIQDSIGIEPTFSIDYHKSKPDSLYTAYITGDGNSYNMQLNHKKFSRLSKQKTINVAIHEVSGHAVNFNLIKQKLTPNSGLDITTTIEPLNFGTEGLALSLENMLPELQKTPLITKALTHLNLTNRMVMSNAALQLNTNKLDFDQALSYIIATDPFLETEHQRENLKAFGNDALATKLYLGIYGHAESAWHDIATKINALPDTEKTQTRAEFLTQVYTNFTTAADIKPWQEKLGLESRLVC